mmetsp:Transcript_23251/g.58798  ORF Transcript_23251/g.58798 Transcript_23251/m.58798 type:complete len:1376 (-) Transcript_23251:470-4597(-)|eukprot:CAMPEP_0178983540 /NCGR_PEP_ID=MMETSP0795-20121207/1117_1 /TAXON_ID=88552 /ORGANISM="Amoebophrya sp., Strain Ameob2" /LENGTH=1375 /DNA_ID=CAMNT_0020674325 /DNA_START=753 /DNA_END=4880 /DNA_ORIENTATION=-
MPFRVSQAAWARQVEEKFDPDEYLQADAEATRLARLECRGASSPVPAVRVAELKSRRERFEHVRRKVDLMREGGYSDAVLHQQLVQGACELAYLLAFLLFLVALPEVFFGFEDSGRSAGEGGKRDAAMALRVVMLVLVVVRTGFVIYRDHVVRYERQFQLEKAIQLAVTHALEEQGEAVSGRGVVAQPTTLLQEVGKEDTVIEFRSPSWRLRSSLRDPDKLAEAQAWTASKSLALPTPGGGTARSMSFEKKSALAAHAAAAASKVNFYTTGAGGAGAGAVSSVTLQLPGSPVAVGGTSDFSFSPAANSKAGTTASETDGAATDDADVRPPPPSAWPGSPDSKSDSDEEDEDECEPVAELPLGEGLPGVTRASFIQKGPLAKAVQEQNKMLPRRKTEADLLSMRDEDPGAGLGGGGARLLARSRQNSLSVYVTASMAPNIKETGTIGVAKDTVVAEESEESVVKQRRRSSLSVPKNRRNSMPHQQASKRGGPLAQSGNREPSSRSKKKERKENPFSAVFGGVGEKAEAEEEIPFFANDPLANLVTTSGSGGMEKASIETDDDDSAIPSWLVDALKSDGWQPPDGNTSAADVAAGAVGVGGGGSGALAAGGGLSTTAEFDVSTGEQSARNFRLAGQVGGANNATGVRGGSKRSILPSLLGSRRASSVMPVAGPDHVGVGNRRPMPARQDSGLNFLGVLPTAKGGGLGFWRVPLPSRRTSTIPAHASRRASALALTSRRASTIASQFRGPVSELRDESNVIAESTSSNALAAEHSFVGELRGAGFSSAEQRLKLSTSSVEEEAEGEEGDGIGARRPETGGGGAPGSSKGTAQQQQVGGSSGSTTKRRVSIFDDWADPVESKMVKQMRSHSVVLDRSEFVRQYFDSRGAGGGNEDVDRARRDASGAADNEEEFFCEPADAENDSEIIVLPLSEGGANLWGRVANGGVNTGARVWQCNCRDGFHTCMSPRSTNAATTAAATALPSMGGSMLNSQAATRRGSDWKDSGRPSEFMTDRSIVPSPENELHISVLKTTTVPPPPEMMSLPAEGDGENNSATPDSTQMNQMPNQKIPLIETVQPTELQRLLQAQNPEVVVIDVRGRDHEGGHIPNSIWIKTNGVIANPGFLMAEIRARKVTSVVFTCMYSVLRARRCCSALAQYQQKERLESKHAGYLIKIQILAGGFHGWLNHFLNQGDHGEKQIEDYTKSCWTKATDDIGNLGYVHVMDALWSEAGQKKLIKNLEEELEKCALEKLARGGGGRDEDEQVGGDVSGQRPDVEDEEDVGVRPHPPSSPAGEIVEMDGLGRAGGVDADVLGRAATEGGVEMGFMAGIVGNAQDVEVEQQQGTGRQESRYGEVADEEGTARLSGAATVGADDDRGAR